LFTSERYLPGNEKQAMPRMRCLSLVGNAQRMSRMKNLIVQACMLNTLIEYAFCGIHSPRDLTK
jgi:hypothetical protein